MHKFKIGDAVKIKPYCEIKKTLEKHCHKKSGLYFNPNMKRYCGDGEVHHISYALIPPNKYELVNNDGWAWHEDWLEPFDTPRISIDIDPRNPREAHEAVAKACQEWKDKQRGWTDGEISEAKRISEEIILNLFHRKMSCDFYELVWQKRKWVECYIHPARYPDNKRRYVAVPLGDDVYDFYIGCCVCLCKAAERDIPDFILQKNRGD